MKKLVSLACLGTIATTLLAMVVLIVPSPSIEAASPCVRCPLYPIPDSCPPCTQWVAQTCRKCGHCEKIPGCQT
jgi:hypothetical protein